VGAECGGVWVSDGDNELCGQVAAIEPAAVFISRHVGEVLPEGRGLLWPALTHTWRGVCLRSWINTAWTGRTKGKRTSHK